MNRRHLLSIWHASEFWYYPVLILLLLFYLAYTWWSVSHRGLFEYVGIDFRAIYSSARILHTMGWAPVYDLTIQAQFQQSLYNKFATDWPWGAGYRTVGMPYLPVFVAPLQLLLLFEPIPGFLAWTVINALLLLLYLFRFTKACQIFEKPILLAAITCFPFFLTLLFGQVEVWPLIFLGEFFLARLQGREFKSGLWLGGLWLKPQILILLLPGLLFTRRIKTMTGFALTSIAILATSWYLAGASGLSSLLGIFLGLLNPAGLPATFPQSMMNWRALALNFLVFLSPEISWGLAIVGMVLTTFLGLGLWVRADKESEQFPVAVLGLLAATFAVTWHSHLHMALVIIPPLIYLVAKRELPHFLLILWIILPPFVFFSTISYRTIGPAHQWAGVSMLVVNLLLVLWASRALRLNRE